MARYLIVLLIVCLSFVSLGQDSVLNQKLKSGIFMTHKEFVDNKPSSIELLLPLFAVPIRNGENSIDTDTVYITDETLDKDKRPFAIYSDGTLYIKYGRYYRRMDHAGKYPFVITRANVIKTSDEWQAEFVSSLWYINSSGKWILSTPQSIGFLVRSEKDLAKEFEKEKYSRAVFVKYLIMMNKRYPFN